MQEMSEGSCEIASKLEERTLAICCVFMGAFGNRSVLKGIMSAILLAKIASACHSINFSWNVE